MGSFKVLHLEDNMQVQSFDIGLIPLDGSKDITFEFEIVEVYQGEKFKDTVITELELDGVGDH